jgi:uncharacterized C2H2 Zn-finger protein
MVTMRKPDKSIALRCPRCGYKWTPRTVKPKQCPACKVRLAYDKSPIRGIGQVKPHGYTKMIGGESGMSKGTTTKQKRIVQNEIKKREQPANAQFSKIDSNVDAIQRKFNKRVW